MPKKTSSAKAPEKTQENTFVEDDEKPSSKTQENAFVEDDVKPLSKLKKRSNEIDEIFAGKKRKKPEGKKSEKLNKDESVEPKLVKKKKEKKKSKGAAEGGLADAPARSREKTEDGLTIYTEDELGINNADAGNTPLCPFDCSCCF